MNARIVKFKLPDTQAKKLLNQIAENTGDVKFTKHARQQMRKRKITLPQVIDCLRRGVIIESPCLNYQGNWKLTIEHYTCGETIACAAEIDMTSPKIIVITAFWVE